MNDKRTNVYYNATTNAIHIDSGSKTTTISLPHGIDPTEVAYVIKSEALLSIINQLAN